MLWMYSCEQVNGSWPQSEWSLRADGWQKLRSECIITNCVKCYEGKNWILWNRKHFSLKKSIRKVSLAINLSQDLKDVKEAVTWSYSVFFMKEENEAWRSNQSKVTLLLNSWTYLNPNCLVPKAISFTDQKWIDDFSKVDIQMANKHTRRCYTQLVNREMQVKILIRYHFTWEWLW